MDETPQEAVAQRRRSLAMTLVNLRGWLSTSPPQGWDAQGLVQVLDALKVAIVAVQAPVARPDIEEAASILSKRVEDHYNAKNRFIGKGLTPENREACDLTYKAMIEAMLAYNRKSGEGHPWYAAALEPTPPAPRCRGFGGEPPGEGHPWCCLRAGEYNGFGSDGPRKFICPKGCGCHD